MGWDAAKQPFSSENLKLIENINIKEQVKLLRDKVKIREICLRNFAVANMILKKYAKAGKTLFEIG